MSVGQDNRWQKDAADQNFDYMFKLLIIGNSSVGKTSFLFRYADDSFTSAFVSTVGIDFKVKTVFRQDKRVKLQIWVRQIYRAPRQALAWPNTKTRHKPISTTNQFSSSCWNELATAVERNHEPCFDLPTGHGRAGAIQNHHNGLLPRSYGLLVDVRHHQWRIFQQCSGLVSCPFQIPKMF